jgi:hypothetical protein
VILPFGRQISAKLIKHSCVDQTAALEGANQEEPAEKGGPYVRWTSRGTEGASGARKGKRVAHNPLTRQALVCLLLTQSRLIYRKPFSLVRRTRERQALIGRQASGGGAGGVISAAAGALPADSLVPGRRVLIQTHTSSSPPHVTTKRAMAAVVAARARQRA